MPEEMGILGRDGERGKIGTTVRVKSIKYI